MSKKRKKELHKQYLGLTINRWNTRLWYRMREGINQELDFSNKRIESTKK